ncbi:DNA-directed DNA polymerase delta [Nowakowskiella sp. JEL0078]|nr:DNA-directed DNA polymerase delta [Nowakowskiella sp. JEL0078]
MLLILIRYQAVVGSQFQAKLSKSETEIKKHRFVKLKLTVNNIISHQPEDEWSKIAPLRILSFDIECAGRKGIFPEAEHDPVIQIANMVTIQGESKPFIKNVFTLKECANIAGTQTLCFENEGDLLQAWRDFVVTVN